MRNEVVLKQANPPTGTRRNLSSHPYSDVTPNFLSAASPRDPSTDASQIRGFHSRCGRRWWPQFHFTPSLGGQDNESMIGRLRIAHAWGPTGCREDPSEPS